MEYKAKVIANTRDMGNEEWLALRRRGIGGSDAAAIMGYNPYKSAYAVWADKLGYLPSVEENEKIRLGKDLESYVAKRFAEEKGKKVRRDYSLYQHPEYPWMIGNIDRKIIGENAGLECKTSSDIYLKRFRNGEYPAEYYCQCLHYLAITGWDRWYLYVLVFGNPPLSFVVERKDVEDEIAYLIEQEKQFWEDYVIPRRQPPTDGTASTSEALEAVYGKANKECIVSTQPHLLDQYAAIRAQKKACEKQLDVLGNQIKAEMGNNERMGSPSHMAIWSNRKGKSSLDIDALLKDHPTIDLSLYTKSTMSRAFSVKTEKEESA